MNEQMNTEGKEVYNIVIFYLFLRDSQSSTYTRSSVPFGNKANNIDWYIPGKMWFKDET